MILDAAFMRLWAALRSPGRRKEPSRGWKRADGELAQLAVQEEPVQTSEEPVTCI
jgi:hypothetical protein